MNHRQRGGAAHTLSTLSGTGATGTGARARPIPPPPIGRPSGRPPGKALIILACLWFLMLFDPHWYLAAKGVTPVLKLPVLFFLLLAVILAFGVSSIPEWTRRWTWYAPFLLFIGVGILTTPFALNNGVAREATKQLILYWMLIAGTATIVTRPRYAEWILYLYGLQFLWWGVWGAQTGQVIWHHSFSNYDGFGAFVVGGLGMCYFLAFASPNVWFRRLMYLTAALCALAVVASFARGAALATAALFAVIWLRSPRKGQTFVAAVVAGMIIIIASSVLHPEDSWWAEIMSSFDEGTTEGTGEDRWELWKIAIKVFLERPIFGVGPRNVGIYASLNLTAAEVGGQYALNLGALYGRSMHNFYVTVLAELGLVGSFAFVWILVDFWRRNAVMRTAEASRRWLELGGTFQLRSVALGIEACMVAFLVTAAVYALDGIHWFFTLLALNLMVHTVLRMPPRVLRGRRGGQVSNRQ